MTSLTLASASETRAALLRNAGLDVNVMVARIDESALKESLIQQSLRPRDIADALAEAKARKVSSKGVGGLVVGCDQVLDFDGDIISKANSKDDLHKQLLSLSGSTHKLWSASVVYENNEPVWRHVSKAELTMRPLSEDYISDYIERNWPSVRHCVGGYKLEEEGVRFFVRIQGDYFTVLGMPLLELLSWLTLRGSLPS